MSLGAPQDHRLQRPLQAVLFRKEKDESCVFQEERWAGGDGVRRRAGSRRRSRPGARRRPRGERERRRLEGARGKLRADEVLSLHPGARHLRRGERGRRRASPTSRSATRSSASARRPAKRATRRRSPSRRRSSRRSRTSSRTWRPPRSALIGLTALVSIEDTLKLKKGETILIQGGAGGVASFAIQAAKHIGAHVITTTSAANRDYVKKLGADEVIDYNAQDFTKVVSGVDAVFETVGGDVAKRSFSVLKPGGRAAFIASGGTAPVLAAGRRHFAASQGGPRSRASRAHRRAGDLAAPSACRRSRPTSCPRPPRRTR